MDAWLDTSTQIELVGIAAQGRLPTGSRIINDAELTARVGELHTQKGERSSRIWKDFGAENPEKMEHHWNSLHDSLRKDVILEVSHIRRMNRFQVRFRAW